MSKLDENRLSISSEGGRERNDESDSHALARQHKLECAVRTILECIGEDPYRQGVLHTPERYAKALLFLTKGYQDNLSDIINGALFQEDHHDLVVVKDIEVYSLCEHHMVPFTGVIHVGYVPNQKIIGLSKISRIVEMFARRLQIQERLTTDVAQAIQDVLQPQGVAVIVESSHLCMAMRGVEKKSATTITSCVRGSIAMEATRNEFFSLVGFKKR